MTRLPCASLPVLLLLSGCGPWIVPFPQPMLAPTDLVAVPDGDVRAGVGVTPASVYLVPGETVPAVLPVLGVGPLGYGGAARLDAGVGLGAGWDIQAVASPMASGSQYDLRVGKRLIASRRVRLDVVAGGGASWFASTTAEGLDYGYFAFAPHLGPRVALRLGEVVELPVLVELTWSHVVPVYGIHDVDRSAWWVDAGSAAVFHVARGLTLGPGVDVLVSPSGTSPWTAVRMSFGLSYALPLHPSGREVQAPSPPSASAAAAAIAAGAWCEQARSEAVELADTPVRLFRLVADAKSAAACPGAPPGAHGDAVSLERLFLDRYPADPLAAQVQAWLDDDIAAASP